MLQLLALPHGVLGITMKLALVIHDHIEVTFEEGGRSWWICHIGFARSLARRGASVIVVFSVEVMLHRILSVHQFVNVCHEIIDGVCVSFMDLLEQLDVGDPLLVVSNNVFVFDTYKGVTVLEVAVGVLSESFITSHLYSGDVVSIAKKITGCLVVGREKARQCCQEVTHSAGRLLSHRSGALPITRGKYPSMWSSLPLEARAAMLYILSHIHGSERPSYFSMAGLKSLGLSDRPEMS
jgi:hypothetical protein